MADASMSRGRQADQTLSLNMKLISHHEMGGFGGMGEGMGMQKTKDGRRIFWMAHESAPKNFTAVDVTDPRDLKMVVQTDLPHGDVRLVAEPLIGDHDRRKARVAEADGVRTDAERHPLAAG